MINTAKASTLTKQSLTRSEEKVKKHVKLIERTYINNNDSDYTKKIKELDKNFNYSSNSNYYWSDPELSTLYGTSLYEEASPSQRIALNHIYWAGQYIQTAATEASTVFYNQLTARVFSQFNGYETLCKELELETEQERHHIHAFQKMSYKTKIALQGKARLGNPLYKQFKLQFSPINWINSQLLGLQSCTLGSIAKIMLPSRAQSNLFLKELENQNKSIPIQTSALIGLMAGSKPMLRFLTLNWGSSPFLACQYYLIRFMANMLLKDYEYRYSLYFRQLEKKGEFIPAPTAVSRYHLLDESFHTTISQQIAKELYKDFPKPTAYEKFVANLVIYLAQRNTLSGLSGGILCVFRDDAQLMLLFYRLLQSPVFEMSSVEALYWIEKCLCHEHEGFHVNLKYHQRLLSDFRHHFQDFDFFWPVNREMRLMAKGGSIDKAIQSNINSFQQFSKSVSC
ncbi:MAG: hypothetical protein F6J90_35265 [Moorea sp. SIOASIH]|uniref:hypothetical protein n=1 Tax=Moorena sp. SIOASIH TaxID=2607817 RepID=UPI0013BA7540|nr:hypothetical protein [Moorena sp. SIOASIH]NEO41306.1 hypothetical protein [Moorena sp. SIOASIH]